jgi:hypothetical protein
MQVLKNTANKTGFLNKTVEQQIEALAEDFCNGMDYGYKIDSVKKGKNGFYNVSVVCLTGAMAGVCFMWNPETQTDYYLGESVNCGETWEIHPVLLEDFKDNIISV